MAELTAARPTGGVRAGRRERDLMPGTMIGIAAATSLVVFGLAVAVIWLSFYTGLPGTPERQASFANYLRVFGDAQTYIVLENTLQFSAVAVLVACAFGIPMAWLAERTDLPGKTALFTIMTTGLLIPGFTVAMGWIFLMQPRIGILNRWAMDLFGLTTPPFNIATIVGMGWVEGLALAPLTFVMTAALFRMMDPALEEASYAAGASYRQTFFRVTLPLIWPGVAAAMLYSFIIGFAAFDVPAIIGWSRRIFTFSTQIYFYVNPDTDLPRYGAAAALGAAMVPLAIAMSVWYARIQRNAARFQVVTGKGYRPRLIPLGRGAWIAWGLLGLYIFLGQGIPVLALVWSSLLSFFRPPSLEALNFVSFANYHRLPWELIGEGVKHTGLLVLLTPTIVIGLSLAFSWVVVRSRLRWRAAFDFFAFLPHAVPGIIFGVGALLVALFVVDKAIPLYGSIWLILICYVIIRLSYGTRVMNGALIQIHGELEEASWVAGARRWAAFRRVVMPLLVPAMLYAWLWLALLTYRELTIATLLSAQGNTTLAVVVWGLWVSGGMGPASALTVIVLILLMPLVALYWLVSRRASTIARAAGSGGG